MDDGTSGSGTGRFEHQAVFYDGPGEFAAATVPFIRDGLGLREPVLVAVLPDRIRRLRSALGPDAEQVEFVDMAEVGGNPARIISVWRHFVHSSAAGPSPRGIGEPVWSGRRDVEIEECRLHESLLNVAFDDGPAWRLMCPYDVESLPATVLEDAVRTHPRSAPAPVGRACGYGGHGLAHAGFTAPLPPVHKDAHCVVFGEQDLTHLRRLVHAWARQAGLCESVASSLVLAVHELATNSVVHAAGRGVVRAWTEPGDFVVEVADDGHITDPLVGRELVVDAAEGGRGVWIANQLCDLVQLRSTGTGTVARLHSWL